MKDLVHILNGDALAQRFPAAIKGQKIIMRECLIDGPVSASSFKEFCEIRSRYLTSYDEVADNEYYLSSVPELQKINALSSDENISVYCWFEHDLFCQINFWYVCDVLKKNSVENIYFVQPNTGNEFSFGHMSEQMLETAHKQALLLRNNDLQIFSALWQHYKTQQFDTMLSQEKSIFTRFPFLENAINAQLGQCPDAQGYTRPERTLLAIMNELDTEEFAPVFQSFNQQEAIYSFGDIQVKRMFDRLLASKNQ